MIQVIGAGGHGKVIVAALLEAGVEVAGVFDDRSELRGTALCGVEVVGGVGDVERGRPAVLAIGDNRARAELARRLDLSWATVVHPWSWVHRSAVLAPGVVVMAGASLDLRQQVEIKRTLGGILAHRQQLHGAPGVLDGLRRPTQSHRGQPHR